MLKKLALAAVAAGALAAVRKRAGGKAEADLWHEATRGPNAVSTPTCRAMPMPAPRNAPSNPNAAVCAM